MSSAPAESKRTGDLPRTRPLEAGLFLVLVGTPLVLFPMSTAPFADPKVVVLLTGALLVAVSGPRMPRGLALAAGLWAVTLGLAAALGDDPYWSLMGAENQGAGALLLAGSAFLLAAGAGVPAELRERLPRWLATTGIVVAAVAVAQQFVTLETATWDLGNRGSTLGQPVALGAFTAVGVVAAASLPPGRLLGAGLFVLGSGLAVAANRGGWIGAGLGLGILLWRTRASRRRVAFVLVPVVSAMVLWTAVDTLDVLPARTSPARNFNQEDVGQGLATRGHAWSASLQAWTERPLLGYGPATTWGAYLAAATPSTMRGARRGFGDAHNLPVESLVTTGVAGAGALAALSIAAAVRMRRAPPSGAWAAGGVAALVVYHLLQPVNVVVTPLLFLLAGLTVGAAERGPPRGVRARWVAFLVGLGLVLSLARLGASGLEWYARTYTSEPALRTALVLEPRRLSATRELAVHRALDWRARDAEARAEAEKLADRLVDRHPWHPGVRLAAADIAMLLENERAAERRLWEHLERFPNDPLALMGAARLAAERGDEETVKALRRRLATLGHDEDARRLRRKLADETS